MPPQTDLPPERLYESRVLFARAPAIVFPILASVFVGMRFYVRRYIVGGVGPDDWLALLAVVCIWTTAGMMLWGTTIGYGRLIWDVGDSSLAQLRDLMTVYPLIAQMGSMAIQLSILTFYRRLSTSRGFHNLLYVLMGFAVFSCVFRLVYTSIWCFHITPGPKFCTKVRSVGVIATIVSICLNSIIWCMPMPLLWRLKISIRKRLGLIILFSIGMIAVTASVAKLTVMKGRKRNGTDPPWVSPLLSFLYQTEVSIGIICACLPTLSPLLTQSSCFGRTQKALPVVVVDMDGLEGEINSGSGTKLADRANAGWEGASLTSTWQEVQRYYHTRWGRKRSIIEVADLEGFGVLDSYPENVHLNVNRQGDHASLDLGEQIGLASMSSQPVEIKSDVRPDSSGKTHNPIHLQLSPPAPGIHVHKSGEIPQPVSDFLPSTLQQSGYTKAGNDLKSGESVEGLLSSMASISKLTTFTTGKTYNTSGSSTT